MCDDGEELLRLRMRATKPPRVFAGYCIGGPYHGGRLAHYAETFRVPMLVDDDSADPRYLEGAYEWAEDKWIWRQPWNA